jgi:flagellar hook-associated protein 3 FlgL
MVKKNGTTEPTADTVNVTGSEIFGMDLFDDPNSGNSPSGTAMLNEMLTIHAKVVADDQLWMATDGVTIADEAHAQTVKTETKLGARTQLYNSVTTMLTTQNELITNDITNTSATDVAKLAVQLMQEQTIYNMSLSLGARILPQSLADYL